jgi:hypothetical protein
MQRNCCCLLNRSVLSWPGATNVFTGLSIWQPVTRMPMAHHDVLIGSNGLHKNNPIIGD